MQRNELRELRDRLQLGWLMVIANCTALIIMAQASVRTMRRLVKEMREERLRWPDGSIVQLRPPQPCRRRRRREGGQQKRERERWLSLPSRRASASESGAHRASGKSLPPTAGEHRSEAARSYSRTG